MHILLLIWLWLGKAPSRATDHLVGLILCGIWYYWPPSLSILSWYSSHLICLLYYLCLPFSGHCSDSTALGGWGWGVVPYILVFLMDLSLFVLAFGVIIFTPMASTISMLVILNSQETPLPTNHSTPQLLSGHLPLDLSDASLCSQLNSSSSTCTSLSWTTFWVKPKSSLTLSFHPSHPGI